MSAWFRDFVSSLVGLALVSAPLTAAIAQAPPDSPPARPRLPDDPPPPPAPASPWLDRVHPSASLNLMLHMRPDLVVEDPASFSLWLGATVFLREAKWSPFITAGALLDVHRRDPPTPHYQELVPALRLGVARVGGDPHSWNNRTMAYAQIYGIMGYRLSTRRSQAVRVGVGISAPVIAAGALFACANGLPIPNLLELTLDIDPRTGERRPVLMVGIGI